MTSLTKNSHPPSKKFFFECRLEDLPRLLRLLPGLQSIPDWRKSRAKPHAFRHFFFRKSPNPSGRQRVKNKEIKNASFFHLYSLKFFIIAPHGSTWLVEVTQITKPDSLHLSTNVLFWVWTVIIFSCKYIGPSMQIVKKKKQIVGARCVCG